MKSINSAKNPSSNIIFHIFAGFCALVWGTTFLVSSVLLETFTPVQIIIMRAFLAYLALWLLCREWYVSLKDEFYFFLLAVFGNTLYYLCENTALLYTYTSNVSILVSAAPLATALVFLIFRSNEAARLNRQMVTGMLLAFAGMSLVVLNGAIVLHLSFLGDLLSIGGALCWGFYSLILLRFTDRFSSFFISRKLMFYSVLTLLPLLLLEGAPFPVRALFKPENLLGILFLGIIGSALCYAAWGYSCAGLGVVKANMYIYTIPFVTLAAGAFFFHEQITVMAVLGAVLIAVGMKVSAV